MEECTALDPRFKSLSWLSDVDRDSVYSRVSQIAAATMDSQSNDELEDNTAVELAETTPDVALAG